MKMIKSGNKHVCKQARSDPAMPFFRDPTTAWRSKAMAGGGGGGATNAWFNGLMAKGTAPPLAHRDQIDEPRWSALKMPPLALETGSRFGCRGGRKQHGCLCNHKKDQPSTRHTNKPGAPRDPGFALVHCARCAASGTAGQNLRHAEDTLRTAERSSQGHPRRRNVRAGRPARPTRRHDGQTRNGPIRKGPLQKALKTKASSGQGPR